MSDTETVTVDTANSSDPTVPNVGSPVVSPTPEAEVVTSDAGEGAPPADSDEAKARRGRGGLEAEVKRVCDSFVNGTLTVPENELLTPHRIAKAIKEGGSEKASTGAVAAVLARWKEYGYAVLNEKPLAFTDYTDAARDEGLTALKAASAERKRAARAAAKAAEASAAPAAPAAPVEADPTPAPEAEQPADSYPTGSDTEQNVTQTV